MGMSIDNTYNPTPMSKDEIVETLKTMVFGIQAFERFDAKEREALDKAWNLIDQYEARLKADHWIPVTERLPEPLTFVYATCRSLVDNRENWVVETIYAPIPKEYNPRHYSDWGNIPMLNWGDAEVIAWMKREIPEPYKGNT